MVALLGDLRREMNGAVADAMRFYGKPYGLNYGVSLVTIRDIARRYPRDYGFAAFLLRQQVRELQLAAMTIVEPAGFSLHDADMWAAAVVNSELAEEIAFAFLRHVPQVGCVVDEWLRSDSPMVVYAASMTAAHAAVPLSEERAEAVSNVVARFGGERFIARGIVAWLDRCGCDAAATIDRLPHNSAADYIREELSWRMEFRE